jgi:hypothetical protein
VLGGVLGSIAGAQPPLSAEALIERAALDESQAVALERGEIVAVDVARLEREQSQLAASLLVWVDAPLERVREVISSDAALLHEPGTRFQELHGRDDPLSLVEYVADERQEARRLLRVQPGDRFNLSADEIRLINEVATEEGTDISLASDAYREVLRARYRAYRERGLAGVDPYVRRTTVTSPAAQFVTALESFELLEEFYPDFHAAFRDFPAGARDDINHRFYIRKQVVQRRPVFVLVHWMQRDADDYLLFAQRQYYVGHTYNMAQTIVGCLPFRGGTLVAVLNQAFTEQVVGFFRGVGRTFGRRRIEQSMAPLFARIQARAEQ